MTYVSRVCQLELGFLFLSYFRLAIASRGLIASDKKYMPRAVPRPRRLSLGGCIVTARLSMDAAEWARRCSGRFEPDRCSREGRVVGPALAERGALGGGMRLGVRLWRCWLFGC